MEGGCGVVPEGSILEQGNFEEEDTAVRMASKGNLSSTSSGGIVGDVWAVHWRVVTFC